MRGVVEQVVRPLAETAAGKGVVLEIEVAPDVPEVLRGDPTRLSQVVVNLLSNAVKFTDRGRIDVVVGGHRDPDEDDRGHGDQRRAAHENWFGAQVRERHDMAAFRTSADGSMGYIYTLETCERREREQWSTRTGDGRKCPTGPTLSMQRVWRNRTLIIETPLIAVSRVLPRSESVTPSRTRELHRGPGLR